MRSSLSLTVQIPPIVVNVAVLASLQTCSLLLHHSYGVRLVRESRRVAVSDADIVDAFRARFGDSSYLSPSNMSCLVVCCSSVLHHRCIYVSDVLRSLCRLVAL